MTSDTSVPEEDFEALGSTVQAEFDKRYAIGELLVQSWRNYDSARMLQLTRSNILQRWEDALTPKKVVNYINAFSADLRSLLLDCRSPSIKHSEGYLIVVPETPIRAEFTFPEDSLYAKEHHDLDGTVIICEEHFVNTMQMYCDDFYTFLAVPHIAESLRTRELTQLSGLELTTVTPSIIKVTLDLKVDYGLG